MILPAEREISSTSALAVEVENAGSWPAEFRRVVVEQRGLIVDYQRERLRIDRLCQDDLEMRIHPPQNRYAPAYRALVAVLEPILVRHRIIAYHCTRLTESEIAGIKRDGLQPLSPELITHRLDHCLAQRHLNQRERKYLGASQVIQGNLSNRHGNRTGMIWFCPNRSTLQQSSGVYRLFRYWGGEAMYCGHEADKNIAHVLRRIGTPCIVTCAVPFAQAVQFGLTFAERFLSEFVSGEVEYPEPSPDFDLYTRKVVAAADVLKIIEFSDPAFEELTRCSTWSGRERITPEE